MGDGWDWTDAYFRMLPIYPKEDRVMIVEVGRTAEVETVPRRDFQAIGSEGRNWNDSVLHAGPARLNWIDIAGVDVSQSKAEPDHFK